MHRRLEIVLNRMFTGDYLSNNIGHEIINMFKDDQGRNYIYIQPYGTYDRSHHGNIDCVLMVRSLPGRHTLEVIGLATGLHEIFNPSLSCKKQWEEHERFIREQGISYGGVSLLNIFNRNMESIEKQPVYLTMQADKVRRPNKPLYIVYGNKDVIDNGNAINILLPHTHQAKCSLKQYFTPSNNDYTALRLLVDNNDLWGIDTEPIKEIRLQVVKEDNFFDILGVADYELAFSNALCYYTEKYPDLVIEFLNMKLNTQLTQPITCLREWNNIDILIEYDDEIVVVENKITSKINGIKKTNGQLVSTQLKKYHDIATRRAAGEFLEKDDPQKRQLRQTPKRVTSFILTPDYNPIKMDDYNTEGFVCKNHYRQLFYSEVYDFLKSHHPEDLYFQEFLKGLLKHTQLYHNDLFEETREKFIKQIKKRINHE